ncbi:MAG TPA: TatD family hydrolase [Gammaproteobacteria bacterium]
MRWVDIGVNLAHDSFDADRDAVIAAARAAGVDRLIVTGTSVAASARALELAERQPGELFATAGVHPHHAGEFDGATAAALEPLLAHPRVVAVGECGLDFFRDFAPRPAQEAAFTAQLELAAAAGKPVFLHQRDAHERFVALLAPWRDRLAGGVAHCFTGGVRELETYLDLGLHIGVTGWLCDERRGHALREALPRVPLDRLLLETDAPYLLPRDLPSPPRNRRNEPQYLPHVAARAAALMGRSVEELAAATTANAERLFRLS